MQRDLGPGGLGSALLVACASLTIGAAANVMFRLPGFTIAATLIVAAEALGGRRRVAEDQVTARLALVGLGGFLGLFAAASLRAPLIEWIGTLPGVGLALAISLVLSTIAASGIVEKLAATGRGVRVVAMIATALGATLVGVSGSLGLPSWIAGAALGVLVGLLGLARATPHHRALASLEGAVQGQLDGDGWISFPDGRPAVRAPNVGGRGPVAVVLRTGRRRSAYRDDDGGEVLTIVPGTLDRIRHQLRLEAARHDALAVGAVTLMGAPLVAAACSALR